MLYLLFLTMNTLCVNTIVLKQSDEIYKQNILFESGFILKCKAKQATTRTLFS